MDRIKPLHIIWLYILAYAGFVPFYQYQINPDAVSYIACAEHYANGHFAKALNGYWSPLLCWLIVPFIKIHFEPLLAIKIINLCFSVWTLFLLSKTASYYIRNTFYTVCLLLICSAHLLLYSLTTATPDIVALALMLWVLSRILSIINQPDTTNTILLGVAGALSYLAKYYNFYAFLLTLALSILYAIMYARQTAVIKSILLSGLVFGAIAGSWIFLLYTKYGVFTPTTASAFNIALPGQPYPHYPFLIGNALLHLDYSSYTYTSWEDPFYYQLSEGNPKQTFFTHLFIQIKENIHTLIFYHVMEIATGITGLVILWVKRRSLRHSLLLILTIALFYPLGYLFTILENRYIFFSVSIVLMLFFVALDQLEIRKGMRLVIVFFSILLTFIPLFRMYNMPIANKQHDLLTDPKLSDTNMICSSKAWASTLYCCYFNHAKLYDALKPEVIDSTFLSSHPEFDYYVCLENETPKVLKHKNCIHAGEFVIISLK